MDARMNKDLRLKEDSSEGEAPIITDLSDLSDPSDPSDPSDLSDLCRFDVGDGLEA